MIHSHNLLVSLLAIMLTACSSEQPQSQASVTVQEPVQSSVIALTVPVDRWEQGTKDFGGTILDVRTEAEVGEGMVAGAVNMDVLARGFDERIKSLSKDQPVHVYCRSGGRSSKAMGILVENGFTEVYNMDGGMIAWEAAGKPIAKP
jgi:rhodanese-related sulfurtransferase